MASLQQLLQQFGGGGGAGAAGGGVDLPVADTAETIQISSMALLKMLKHGRLGIPMEVMGLMLGEFVDEYTVTCVDVFAMPQHGTGVSVEAVDPVFQTKMLDMLKQTGRPEMVVGWYHSHPGFGTWLSGVDINTQQSFEALNPRAVAVVVDPVQSVKGKVMLDAFRLIKPETMMMGREPRQTTSNIGFMQKPSIHALINGLNRYYYQINVSYRKNDLEMRMLQNLNQRNWSTGLNAESFVQRSEQNAKTIGTMAKLTDSYASRCKEEETKTAEQLSVSRVGKLDPKKHLMTNVQDLMNANIDQCLVTMLNTIVF